VLSSGCQIIIVVHVVSSTSYLPVTSSGDSWPYKHYWHSFLSELGHRLTGVSGDPHVTMYLFHRVTLAVQRYNLVALRATFSVPAKLD